jgi:hypothetical protein
MPSAHGDGAPINSAARLDSPGPSIFG